MPSFSEQGLSGLNRQAGIVTEEEFIPDLSGRNAIRTYKSMRDNDPIVGAILFAIDMLIRQVDWRVDPMGNDPSAIEASEFLHSCMHDMTMTWPDLMSEVMSMLVFGWSFHEIVYKHRKGATKDSKTSSKFDDGKVGWRKIPIRGQESLDRWIFDDDGGVTGFVQKPPPRFEDIEIPMEKGLLFRTTTYKNNPEGRSVLRNSYRPWYYKRRIEEIEGVGIERDLAGLPFAKVDPKILSDTATDEEKKILAAIKEIVSNVRRDSQEGVVFPSLYDEEGHELYSFSLLSAGGSRQFDTSAIIERYSRQMAMTVMADFILLGHESVGSFALSSNKTNLFAVAIGAWMDMIAGVFNRYAIPRLFALNGFATEVTPEIKHSDIEKQDLTELGSILTALNGAGMPIFPDARLEAWFRQVVGMPEQSEEEARFAGFPTLPTGTAKPATNGNEPEPKDEEVPA